MDMTDDLTNPLETIVSILKNATTGLGTTGYEIYKDDGSTSCTLLVTYKLAKEKLTALFGGSQDYDVIVTVEPGEAEDNWIGFSTKEWREEIIIRIHVIEKHSAVGTAKKIITPELVRYKAENSLRKFVKAKLRAPGGSVKIWTARTYTPSEDSSVRPIMYISTVVTETWSYYNPTCVSGEQVQDSGFESGTLLPYWVKSGTVTVLTAQKHTGTYSITISGTNSYVNQTGLNIEVDCISAASIWIKGNIPCPAYGTVTVRITYSDASTTSISGLTGTTSWAEHSILAQLTSGKTINEIRITLTNNSDIRVDDVCITGSGA